MGSVLPIRFCIGSLSSSLVASVLLIRFCVVSLGGASLPLLPWLLSGGDVASAHWSAVARIRSALGCVGSLGGYYWLASLPLLPWLLFGDVASAHWSAVARIRSVCAVVASIRFQRWVIAVVASAPSVPSCSLQFGGGLPRDGQMRKSRSLCMVVGVRWLMVSFTRRWLYWEETSCGCCATDACEAKNAPQNSHE